jgi:hypothetical protein
MLSAENKTNAKLSKRSNKSIVRITKPELNRKIMKEFT